MTPDKADPHLPHALRILARDIHCEDGIATQCIREAADEIDRLRLAAEEREAVERMTPDTSDICITTRLRQTRANMLGTADEDHYWDCHAAADEIDRLRLTDPVLLAAEVRRLQAVIANGDYPEADKAAEQDNTPPSHTTPDECTVPTQWTSRPYWVDPPSGWRYGFPRLYDPATDGDMVEWMIANGYPETLARQGLACTFTAQTEDGEK